MNNTRLLPQVISSTLGLLLFVACSTPQPTPTPTPAPTVTPTPTSSPLEVRVGEWSGTTEFGSFTFIVSPNGRKITSLELSYQDGSVFGSASLTPVGEGGQIDEEGSFKLAYVEPDALVTFRAQFSQDGTSATGLWETDIYQTDTVISEEWEIER